MIVHPDKGGHGPVKSGRSFDVAPTAYEAVLSCTESFGTSAERSEEAAKERRAFAKKKTAEELWGKRDKQRQQRP